ncbi:pyridoxamine 5'-phosphate oxidase [Allostreptomyces psammosilenae]|uniref:Pyridoxine/pyridoxamine 5'-phosphate oxidase n=1 Tax=Allostreptomyces psammosilenae TaxID=1892865 RepID=A0A853A0R2_9ACTN|nr:pyridoxamine 5'-phosphate oxidase [Allostreptomyces psammosilenae]NYI07727.1 pyridoxamine 5'-phosphate oxidase [Allostreptomyces psammosilenae]
MPHSESDSSAVHSAARSGTRSAPGARRPARSPQGLTDPSPTLRLAEARRQYRTEGLHESTADDDPGHLFARWFREAAAAGVVEPNAMVLSTATPEGVPSSRTVLLKGFDERGFVFFTNYTSRKGVELTANPHASLLFPWHAIARQVIVGGDVERLDRAESVAYFRTRPHGSQLGAWASDQSSVVSSRAELEGRFQELADRYPEEEKVPMPPFWGGFLVVPRTVEFWQGRENRLHDRLRYRRDPSSPTGWLRERLCP